MFQQLFGFCVFCLVSVLNLTRQLILDSTLGITFFHFLIFSIFIRILFYLLEFLRGIRISTNEDSNIIDSNYLPKHAKKPYVPRHGRRS